MNEVSEDLRILVDMELPPKDDKYGRHVVKFTILCFVIAFMASLSVVTFALLASLDREGQLKEEVRCVRASSVALDEKISQAISAVINDETSILTALNHFANNRLPELQAEMDKATDLAASGEVAKADLDQAIQDRKDAVNSC